MKNVKVVWVFVLITAPALTGFAQWKNEPSDQDNNRNLISKDRQWFVTYHLNSCPYYNCTYTEVFSVGNDTVINSLYYRNIFVTTGTDAPQKTVLYGQVRETDDRKVYLFRKGIEKLYYDFTIRVRDTISNWQLVKMDTIELYGQNRLRYEFKSVCMSYKAYWIEGIGDTRGLFYEDGFDCLGDVVAEKMGGPVFELNCVKEMESTIYHSGLYDDCWVYDPPE
ncbi:MAG: hypothetical protein MUF15_23915 [Acidobacteria bacterium]|jgi:hypothetical protein|nr:hypothetical protein [Acidobacteriota bacterium]